MYIVCCGWSVGMAGGRAVPPDVQEEPGGPLYTSTLHRNIGSSYPIVLPVTAVKADVLLQRLTRPKQAGWEGRGIGLRFGGVQKIRRSRGFI